MRFLVTPPERITDAMLQQVYLAGFDQNPWVLQAARGAAAAGDPGEMVLRRSVGDSANLFLPWPVEGHGMVTISTGSLMQREEPYYLPLELARGKISLLRNQINEWQSHGLAIGGEIFQGVEAAMGFLRESLRRPHDSAESAAAAERSLISALDAGVALARCYTDQALSARQRAAGMTKTLFAAELGSATLDRQTAMALATTFNAARAPLPWCDIESSEGERRWDLADRQIDWCKANGLTVCAGPLLQFDRRSLPDWLYLFEGDIESLLSAVTEFIEAAVMRYRDRVDLWICAARANTADVLALSEEEILRIVAELIERTKSLSPQTPLVVSFDQPWVEYAARRAVDVPPLHFADLLLRADLGLAGLMLEINMGYHPGGTLPRDTIEFSRHLDRWSGLDAPIYVSLCVPGSDQPDALAARPTKILTGGGPAESQEAWIERYVPLILAKPFVRGVFWNQLTDARPHDFPNGGLFDRNNRPKPALDALSRIRKKCVF